MHSRKVGGKMKGHKVIPLKVSLDEFISSELVEGIDYGKVGGYTKPTLLKPGAEKISQFLQLAITYSVDHRHEDWQEGVFHFEVRVQLLEGSTSKVVTDGVGSCNSKETQFAHQDAFSIVNTVLKMAKKRALIDAVLNASATSGLFTQDIEDLPPMPLKGGDTAVTRRQLRKIHQLVKELNIEPEVAKELMIMLFQVEHSTKLSKVQASRFIQDLLLLKEKKGVKDE